MLDFRGMTGSYLPLEGSPTGAAAGPWPAIAVVDSERQQLAVRNATTVQTVLECQIADNTSWRASETVILVAGTNTQPPNQQEQQQPAALQQQQQQQGVIICLQCDSQQQALQLWEALHPQQLATATAAPDTQRSIPGAAPAPQDGANRFDLKTDRGSAELYFHYYGMLQHQQNMLQDMVRTGTYHAAITENQADFEGKVVMDVGAGSGILSLFAAQAGAAKVFAVEASDMANFAQLLAENNSVGRVIQVCHSKVEMLKLPEGRVDVLVSEPMGTLLVNERMLETYLYARDHFLKPGGKMFPQVGRIHVAAFSDPMLYNELLGKAMFWQQTSYYGLDMTPLHQPAVQGYFAQVVVDAFDPSVLVSDCASRIFDFATVKEEELHDINIFLSLTVAHPCSVHGIACWFDVLFNGSTSRRWLSTAPGLPTTHWFQLRCCLQQPLLVLAPHTKLWGSLKLKAHERQSYDVLLEMHAPPVGQGMPIQTSTGKFDMKEPYYRQLTAWAQAAAVPQQQVMQQQQQCSVVPNLSVPAADQQAGAEAVAAAAANRNPNGLRLGDATAAAAVSQQQQQQQQMLGGGWGGGVV